MSRYFSTATDNDLYIMNQALDLIHARNIATTGPGMNMEEEQKLANIYEDTRDLLLSRFSWNFALQSQTILNVASALSGHMIPDGFSYRSQLPTDCLRVLQVRNFTGTWKRYQEQFILCDIDTNVDEFEIRYVKQITDASLFDPNFREILIIKLAQKLAGPVRDKESMFKDLYALEKKEILEAFRIHAVEDAEYEDEDTKEAEDEWVTAGR